MTTLITFTDYLTTVRYAYNQKANNSLSMLQSFVRGFKDVYSLLNEGTLGDHTDVAREVLNEKFRLANVRVNMYSRHGATQQALYWTGYRDGIRYVMNELV